MGDIFSKKPFKRTLESVYDEINEAIDEVEDGSNVGDLSTLTTDAKDNAVAAINEVDAHANTAQSAAENAQSTANGKYLKPVDGIPLLDLVAAVQASLGKADTALQEVEIENATPVNAVAATKTLTISGVVIDGETVTIGDDVYEFAADVAQTVTGDNIAVDITAATGKATDGLTLDTQPTAGDTMTIGTKVYTFVPNGTANADGEVSRGTNLATAQANIIAAIKGTDGHNTAHTQVTCDEAFLGDVLAITALIGGVAGNSIATTETFTAGSNVFSAGTLANGSDCIAADAVTALVNAITNLGTEDVTAVDGAGDTVVVTSATKGAIGNSIVLAKSCANATWAGGSTALSGGVDGTVGVQWELKVDASYIYVCIAANTTADTNWRRVSLGTVY